MFSGFHLQRGPAVMGYAEHDYGGLIESVNILEPLSDTEREVVVGSLSAQLYAPGESIIRLGDAGDWSVSTMLLVSLSECRGIKRKRAAQQCCARHLHSIRLRCKLHPRGATNCGRSMSPTHFKRVTELNPVDMSAPRKARERGMRLSEPFIGILRVESPPGSA